MKKLLFLVLSFLLLSANVYASGIFGSNISPLDTTLGRVDASKISTGLLPLARGGLNLDLSATGGANQFLKQLSAGGAITVATIVDADVPNTITLDNLTQITNRAISDTTGTLASTRGGTGLATFAASTFLRASAIDTWAAATIIDADVPDTITASNYLPLAGGTLTGNLLFTDNLYDMGASGATRPRNLYLAGDATIGDQLIVSGVGSHAIGGASNANYQLLLQGIIAVSWGLGLENTLAPPIGNDGAGLFINTGINKAGSGTHSDFVSLRVQPPVIGAGAAALTNASTLKITNAPTAATNNYALWVAGGTSRFDGNFDLSAGARTVSLANVANALNFGNNILSIDELNDRVGIGTTGPGAPLAVGSPAVTYADSATTIASFARSSSPTRFDILTSATGNSILQMGSTGDDDAGAMLYDNNLQEFRWRTNNVGDKMVLNSSGNVGIGTTTFQTGDLLVVNGAIRVTDGGTIPTCAVAYRGMIWHDFGATTVKDSVSICAKAADDTYAFRTIY